MAERERALARRQLLRLSYVGFVSLGLPDTVLGPAWPSMRKELGLPLDRAGVLLLLTTAGVVISSSVSGWVRARVGTASVLVGSTLLAATALSITSLATHWWSLLGAALLAGLGGGAIDASLNEHVAQNHGARHLSWLHACWGIGAATAPLVVAWVLAKGASWRVAYAVLAAVELLLSLSFLRTARAWREHAPMSHAAAVRPMTTGSRAMVASVLMFFVYGGLEAGAGLWTSSLLTGTRGSSPALASAAVALYWGALTVGRILVGLRADSIGPRRVLRFSIVSALAATIALAFPHTPDWIALVALAALGLTLAPIYPLAMHDTALRFGRRWGARLVGYQVGAASLGVATLPFLFGLMAERRSLALLPLSFVAAAAALTGLEWARRR